MDELGKWHTLLESGTKSPSAHPTDIVMSKAKKKGPRKKKLDDSPRDGDESRCHTGILPLPRSATKDQLFLSALRSGITGGDLLDVELHAYTRRTTLGVDSPRAVYANKGALKHVSDYFVTMFEWTFQEGRVSTDDYDYMSDSDLEDAEESDVVSDSAVPGNGRDTGVQTDGVTAPEPRNESQTDTSAWTTPTPLKLADGKPRIPMNPIVLESVAHKTLQSFIFWSLTGKFAFAPLRSQSSSVHLQHDSKAVEPYEPPRCSPKSMYRFAHMCAVPELKKQALDDLVARLTPENILPELFSSLTARYPEVQAAEINALTGRIGFTPAVLGALPLWMAKLGSGELGPRSADVMAALVQKIAQR